VWVCPENRPEPTAIRFARQITLKPVTVCLETKVVVSKMLSYANIKTYKNYSLPLACMGVKLVLILREDRFRVFGNMVLRWIFGP
jgi:hypothetical protein